MIPRHIFLILSVLVHGYDMIDDATVWSAIKDSMPTLRNEIEEILNT